MKNNFYSLLLVGLLLVIFHSVFSLTPLVANDFPLVSQNELLSLFSLPTAWWNRGTAGFGEYSVPFLWFWPKDILYGLAASLGLNFSILERIFGIFPALLIGIFGMRKLLQQMHVGESAIFVGTLIYILNTYFLLLLDGGQLSIAAAYALLPLVFASIHTAFIKNTLRSIFSAALLINFLALLDVRYVYITGILIFLYVLYDLLFWERKMYVPFLSKWLQIGFVSGVMLAGVFAYMIVPALFAQGAALPSGYGNVSQTNFLGFTTLGNAILLLQPHWYKNVFGSLTQLQWEFLLFPLLSFSAPLFQRKNRHVGFWMLIAIVGIFLTKGSLEPFGEIYTWLFTTIPGFSLFRDSSKFFVLVALSYGILSAFTINALIGRFGGSRILPVIAACYALFITFPIWSGNMTGTLSAPRNREAFEKIEHVLANDDKFGRVLWIPSRTPLSYADENHLAVEASRIVQLRPFAIGVVGSYEIFNFLRDSPFIDEILKISSIRYVAFPYPDEKRQTLKEDEKNYYALFLHQLVNAPWSHGQIAEQPMPLITTKESSERVFLAPNHYFVVGSDRIYWDLDEIPEFDLSKNALTFLEDKEAVNLPPESQVILYDKEKLDFAMTQISRANLIFPTANLSSEPNSDGWWKRESSGLIQWRAFLQEKYGLDNLDFDYGGGWAIAEGDRTLKIDDDSLKAGKLLFVRVMTSTKSGSIEIFQGDIKIGEVTTRSGTPETVQLILHGSEEVPDQVLEYEDSRFQWFEIARLVSDTPITIQTHGDINVFNAIAVISEQEWEQAQTAITNYQISDWNVLSENEKAALIATNASGTVTYTMLSPVHYKVKVENIIRPQTLILSESYHHLWTMNGQPSTPVYSLLNGFRVDQNGEYDVYFTAQKYVNYGLVISGIAVLALIYFWQRKFTRGGRLRRQGLIIRI